MGESLPGSVRLRRVAGRHDPGPRSDARRPGAEMCSMRNGDDSWQDSTRELMEEWNFASDEEPSHHSPALADPAVAQPCELGLDNAPAAAPELEADDSF